MTQAHRDLDRDRAPLFATESVGLGVALIMSIFRWRRRRRTPRAGSLGATRDSARSTIGHSLGRRRWRRRGAPIFREFYSGVSINPQIENECWLVTCPGAIVDADTASFLTDLENCDAEDSCPCQAIENSLLATPPPYMSPIRPPARPAHR
jgi:hypothetical protein